MKEKIQFLDVSMHPLTMKETILEIEKRLDKNVFTQHVVVNVAKIVNMQTDMGLKSSVESCDIVNVDGMGVVWGGRFLGHHIPERVAGIDLFFQLLELAERRGNSVFLLGGKENVIKKVVKKLKINYPALKIAGSHHGYFWDDEKAIVNLIQQSNADMLFVAISSPKKEQFIDKWKQKLGVKFVMGVGGTFDVVADKTKRAPIWMQRYGLEWLFRLIQEPKRMWKRYLSSNVKYFVMLLKAKYLTKK